MHKEWRNEKKKINSLKMYLINNCTYMHYAVYSIISDSKEKKLYYIWMQLHVSIDGDDNSLYVSKS